MSRILPHREITPRRPDCLAGGAGFEPGLTESDGVFGRSACPSWGGRVLRFRLRVDVVCVEQPQASWEERIMKHYAVLDVSVKETSICIVDEAGRICREMKVVSHPEDLAAPIVASPMSTSAPSGAEIGGAFGGEKETGAGRES